MALLVTIAIMGISLGAATKYWSNALLRDKEEELIFRGDQYRRAIEIYVYAVPNILEYPRSIDDLFTDPRTGKHLLRKKYKDPFTGGDFIPIYSQTRAQRVIGVRSPCEKEPFRKWDFPAEYKHFEGKNKYSAWEFLVQLPGQSL